jgi:hypothetical protein
MHKTIHFVTLLRICVLEEATIKAEQPSKKSKKQRHPMYSWREKTLTHLGAANWPD